MVERRPGAGAFVAQPKIHFNRLTSFTEQMASRSLAARSKVLYCRVSRGEHEIAARLGLPAENRLVKVERVRQGANEPVAIRGLTYAGVTNDSGLYRIAQLPAGTYELKIEKPGFATASHAAFVLTVNQIARVDVAMKVGQVTETVEVTSVMRTR